MDSDTEEAQPEVVVKKRPGRPKKQVIRRNIPRYGITDHPSNADLDDNGVNRYELIYDNPMLFRKIFLLFKSMSVAKITLAFEEWGVRMYADDHLGKSRIYVKILGDRMNRYYCHQRYEMCIAPTSFVKLFQTLNKDYSEIQLVINGYQMTNGKMTVTLVNDGLDEDIDTILDVDLVEPYDWRVCADLAEEAVYPIRFEMSFKQFKKKVSDVGLLGEVLRIEKNGTSPLEITYSFANRRGLQRGYLRNPALINLRSLIDPDDIFSTAVYLEYLKHLSQSQVAETIRISANIGPYIIFTVLLDQDDDKHNSKLKVPDTERCVIQIITETVSLDGPR